MEFQSVTGSVTGVDLFRRTSLVFSLGLSPASTAAVLPLVLTTAVATAYATEAAASLELLRRGVEKKDVGYIFLTSY